MSTEIEQLESRIANLKRDLAKEEQRLEKIMNDPTRPEEQNYGGIKTMDDWHQYALRGKWLANYQPGKIDVFEPNGGGSYGSIYGALADELGKINDSWNYRIYEKRRSEYVEEGRK